MIVLQTNLLGVGVRGQAICVLKIDPNVRAARSQRADASSPGHTLSRG